MQGRCGGHKSGVFEKQSEDQGGFSVMTKGKVLGEQITEVGKGHA